MKITISTGKIDLSIIKRYLFENAKRILHFSTLISHETDSNRLAELHREVFPLKDMEKDLEYLSDVAKYSVDIRVAR